MKKLDKIVLGIIGISMGLTAGCAETRNISRQKIEEPVPLVVSNPINSSKIKLVSKADISLETNEMINVLIRQRDYLDFRRKYDSYAGQINSSLDGGLFENADSLVRELAGKLENDQSRYAQQYLEKIRDFHYTIFEAYNLDEHIKKSFPSVDKHDIRKVYDKIRFHPLSGEKEIVGRNIPIEQLEEDMKNENIR